MKNFPIVIFCALLTTACSSPPFLANDASNHLSLIKQEAPGATIPPLVLGHPPFFDYSAQSKNSRYTVDAHKIPVADLLFAMAQDSSLNLDLSGEVAGLISIRAIDQSLSELLDRICRTTDLRWHLQGNTLVVEPDTPYLEHYAINYVNMARETTGGVTVTTQINSSLNSTNTPVQNPAGNNSQTRIENRSTHRFWNSLESNIKDLLRETDKILPEGSSDTLIERSDWQSTTGSGYVPNKAQRKAAKAGNSNITASPGNPLAQSPSPALLEQEDKTLIHRSTFREAASVIVNSESGVVSVRARARQHEKIRQFIQQVTQSARRQVVIEATIAEVQLSQNYQQGIDWSALHTGRAGFTLKQAASNLSAPTSSIFELAYNNTNSALGSLSASIRLLESFGRVKVLSSPKLAVLNNQSAILKVIDNQVYFTVKADVSQNQTTTVTTYTTTLNSVPVGLVMNVTPQIGEDGMVLLNVRPSISRIIGTVEDPNPALKSANVTSRIPVIRTREMESVIRIGDGNVAVMGGLMEDHLQDQTDQIPGAEQIPVLGRLFKNQETTRQKSELVIFLRPVVVNDGAPNEVRARPSLEARASE